MPQYFAATSSDCIDSIAFENGLLPDVLWNHPQNAALKQLRKNRNILMEGDVVYIPDIRARVEPAATDKVHRFVRKLVGAKIEFKMLKMGKPIPDAPYVLVIEGRLQKGKTDGHGMVRAYISPDATKGELKVFPKDGEEIVYALQLGGMDPWNEISGYQKRLENLGYGILLDSYGTFGEGTSFAIALFQNDNGLPVTGQADDSTLAKIKDVYGN